MSAICQNFVQNAWKKDLCSNCFKSKDEHNQVKAKAAPAASSRPTAAGIIRSSHKTKPRRSVEFTKELTEVIGYGGEDWSSDVDEPSEDESSADDDADVVEEEDKELQRITKANTDYNTSSMLESVEVKKSFTQLMLGKPQVDSEGRKQTLLVSVTPFGHENPNASKKASKTISHIPIAKTSKEAFVESKGGVVLTSYTKNNTLDNEEKSLLDEISETLESGKNPIQIISRKKTQKEVVLSKPEIKSNKENIEQEIQSSESISENIINEKVADAKSAKTNIPERKNGLTRTTAIKRDQEKPVVYQTSTAKIELMNSKNLKLSASKENISSKLKCDNVSPSTKVQEQKATPKIEAEATESVKVNGNVREKEIEEGKVTLPEAVNGICHDVPKQQSDSSDESIISTCSEDSIKEESKKEPEILTSSLDSTAASDKVIGLPPVPKPYNISMAQSRELAGEPDGRADPEINEPPALPLTPPPNLDNHSSFLHSNVKTCEKPKVPSKPATILIRKPAAGNHNADGQNHQTVLSTFASEKQMAEQKFKLEKQDSNGSDIYRTGNKRRAPKPPLSEDLSPVYARTMMNGVGSDSPVTKDRRERAASCSPKITNLICDSPQGEVAPVVHTVLPEPVPRHSLSLSIDNLTSGVAEEKKKEKKGRFSLKKFLRMGSSKDLPKISNEVAKIEEAEPLPHPRPRLVIVHPLELNGAKVEVVAKPLIAPDQVDHCSTKGTKQNEYMVPNVVISNGHDNYAHRASKPPPPPRHYDDWNYSKPNLPHPPKSQEILNKQREMVGHVSTTKKIETVYANIGEVRSAITPHKPQRTASMREREAQQQKRSGNSYDHVNMQQHKDANENVYDYITSARSSSPECDSNKNSPTSKTTRMKNGFAQRSESNMDVSSEYFKYQNIPRSLSLTYCGSETESEIYSPYSFYGSESEIAEDDHEWTAPGSRTHKLRSRKGRSIVHKNLEDNYGAVVVANHEALAQVLENIQQTVTIQPALRGLKASPNLRWNDFSIKGGMQPVIIGPRAFHQAVWGSQHVTLVISTRSVPTSSLSLGTFSLIPVTEFSDLIPVKYLPVKNSEDVKYVQASVAVLPWMQVNTIQSYGELLKSKAVQNGDDNWKDVSFILLQLVNALKTLQAQGIEELPLLLTSFVLCREVDKDSYNRLYVLQGLGEDITRKKEEDKFGTLCMCASRALLHLQSSLKLSSLIQSLLSNERAVSLTQVKSVLEFSLWGPTDVGLGSTVRERELALQRWLDLQRATVLHGLVCTKIHLTVYEECHLLFLVRSNARMICDATLLLESNSLQNSIVGGGHAPK